jgi:predicted secreted protein
MDLGVVLVVVLEAVVEAVTEAVLGVASEVALEVALEEVQVQAALEVGGVDSGWVEASPFSTVRGLLRKRRKYTCLQEI